FGVWGVGGQTEASTGLAGRWVIGRMLGEVGRDRLVPTGGARLGDALLVTKGVPLEGTSIIARTRAAELRARGYDEAWLERARGVAARLSVVPEALLAADLVRVHEMRHTAEGGGAAAPVGRRGAAGVGLAGAGEGRRGRG